MTEQLWFSRPHSGVENREVSQFFSKLAADITIHSFGCQQRQLSATLMANENNDLPAIMPSKSADPRQGLLDLGIERQIETD